jgi:hypothetical protein
MFLLFFIFDCTLQTILDFFMMLPEPRLIGELLYTVCSLFVIHLFVSLHWTLLSPKKHALLHSPLRGTNTQDSSLMIPSHFRTVGLGSM